MKNTVLGIKIDYGMSMSDVVGFIDDSIKGHISRHICTTNPEFIMNAQENPSFKDVLNSADLSLPDGSGILYALNYQQKIKTLNRNDPLFKLKAFLYGLISPFAPQKEFGERIIGVSLFLELCKLSASKNYTIFLLGGRPKNVLGKNSTVAMDLASRCKAKLELQFPGIRIVGATSQFSSAEKDDQQTLDYIHSCMKSEQIDHIDIIFVAYNHPYQDLWLQRNRLKIPALISIAVGGTFDYIAGTKKRAPKVIINMHLEWLYKLFTQPWRIRRIYSAFPLFPIKVFTSILK